jgi:hypothetical protein
VLCRDRDEVGAERMLLGKSGVLGAPDVSIMTFKMTTYHLASRRVKIDPGEVDCTKLVVNNQSDPPQNRKSVCQDYALTHSGDKSWHVAALKFHLDDGYYFIHDEKKAEAPLLIS